MPPFCEKCRRFWTHAEATVAMQHEHDTPTVQIARFRRPNRARHETDCAVYACEASRWVTFEVGGGEDNYCGVTSVGLCIDHGREALESLKQQEATR